MCINEWIDVWTLKKYHDKSRLCVRCVFCEYVGENNDDVWHVRVCVCVCLLAVHADKSGVPANIFISN